MRSPVIYTYRVVTYSHAHSHTSDVHVNEPLFVRTLNDKYIVSLVHFTVFDVVHFSFLLHSFSIQYPSIVFIINALDY